MSADETLLIPLNAPLLRVRRLGVKPYQPVWEAMAAFTDQRTDDSIDELWLVQHEPVFTQGRAGKPEHVLNAGDIPIVQSDRGGQVTYHGPGQLIVYPLIKLKRYDLNVRDLVSLLEVSVVQWLQDYGVSAYAKADAPGVYVNVNADLKEAKIASLGLRIRRGCSFHGVSLNITMDLSPFDRINPCGYAGLHMTQLNDCIDEAIDLAQAEESILTIIANKLGVRLIEGENRLPVFAVDNAQSAD